MGKTREELIAELQAEFQEIKNTLILASTHVVKVLDLTFDDDENGEPYWLVEYQDKSRTYYTIIARYISLKSSLPDDDYEYLIWIWNQNVSEGTI